MFKKREIAATRKKINKEELKHYFNGRIYFGPFSGIKIPEELYSILSLSEILGLYESCLHHVFGDLLNKEVKNVVIVGGNNGYYSGGLSYILHPDKLYVYEMDEKMHPQISSWFIKNSLKLPVLLGEANTSNFNNFNEKVDLLLIDCEGAEETLLDPMLFEWQQKSNIIVELHPFYVKNLINIITKRFSLTHEIELIYDDFQEDEKIEKIITGLDLSIEYPKHPRHRWIIEGESKVYTSGLFMYLKCK
jgi:hypothetical protein